MRTIAIYTPFGRELSFVELKGVEGLSSLYEYRLVLTSKNPNLAATDIIGQTIAVTIDTKGGERVLNGLVTDFGYLSEDEDEQSYHLYTCIMRPNMWYLTQRHDSRVFVDKDILEITRTILDEFGFPYEIQCLNSYRKYGHSTQYQETSFNYLNRLFEQEGLYYYFTHTEGNNTLIIVDDNSAHSPIQGRATIPYHSAVTPGTPDKNYIDIWQQSDRLATKKVNVNDHSYKLANRKLDYNMSTHELGGITTEHYDFYTGFSAKEDAASYAQVRSQDYNAQSKRITAAGNVLTIAPGHIFKLSRHPHDAANTEHLIIHSEYDFKEAGYASGTQQSHYRISFTAIPLSYQYRTPRVTPKPQIIGTQGATVTGPAGEEVHTNGYGDIKVQFHWDRYGPRNQKSSDWIRVAQGSAGGSFGSINTPRIGEEVLIDFINGDSDRPIVIGRLYNSANPPPWGYPQAAKKSGIKSKSFNSPLDNYNELMFNDDAGFELVNLQAQRDLNSLVKNDETRRVNRDRTTIIDKDETITVHGKRTEVVDKDEHITIHQNRTEIVDLDETITIHNNRKERVDDNETIDIGGNRTETVHKSEQITIKGNRDKTVKGNDTLNVKKDRKESINKSRSLTVDRTNTEFVKLGKSVTVGLGYATQVGTIMNTAVGIMQTEQIGRIKKSFVGKSYSITAGDEFKITVGKSSLVMNADGSIIITGSSIITQAEKENKVIGKDVLINPPGASNSGEEEYESNIMVDNYDEDGNLTESYDLADNPSKLSAFAPVAIGAEAAAGAAAVVGGTIYEASKDSGEAIVNAAKSANKTMEGFRAAQMVMGASVMNSVQGIFSSDGPKTGNDELDEVFEGSEKSDDGEYGYKYPGTQEELVEKLGGIEDAVQDIRDNGTSTTTLPDGRKVSTYPARGSNGKPGFSISRPGKRKPAHKGDTQ
ncbi:type VI secretion system tip protein VgrG [Psychrobacter sp. FME13]|uniref:type VI secretion system Vgr family protein n=1 Tax=Psychrobacter sp. FME13 TaxID=2487708 RepID=UPI001787ED16|nr:type VI secretion system tip protein TssI/VgrG [Psychrobacter sp. FME13]MBE0442957.1 type VI secretion system tip protein VgrG [Psychrobacter sp. FME13]